MIRHSSLFCKCFQIKKTSDALYKMFMDGYDLHHEKCPYCHAKGELSFFSQYDRQVIDLVDNEMVYHTISVQRSVCSNCRRTHAILPDFLIPYCQHSIMFILRVLWLYYTRNLSVAKLCQQTAITPSMLYRWKKLFLLHSSLWLSTLERLGNWGQKFVLRLVDLESLSDFLHAFYLKIAISFLQSHKNPANCKGAPL